MNRIRWNEEHVAEAGQPHDPACLSSSGSQAGEARLEAQSSYTPSTHLTEDQIDEELMGDLRPPWDQHLASCGFCETRVSQAAAPLADFKAVTLAWGERRSATLPLHQQIARSAGFHPRLAWAAAASLALAVGFGIPVVSHHMRTETAKVESRAGVPAASVQPAGAPPAGTRTEVAESSTSSREEIVRDNQMLRAIDRDLDTSVEGAETLVLQPVSDVEEPRAAQPLPMQE